MAYISRRLRGENSGRACLKRTFAVKEKQGLREKMVGQKYHNSVLECI